MPPRRFSSSRQSVLSYSPSAEIALTTTKKEPRTIFDQLLELKDCSQVLQPLLRFF